MISRLSVHFVHKRANEGIWIDERRNEVGMQDAKGRLL
jgi:hypothetical protein